MVFCALKDLCKSIFGTCMTVEMCVPLATEHDWDLVNRLLIMDYATETRKWAKE